MPADPHPAPDPILVQRAAASRWATRAQRLGYLLYATAMVAFLIGVATTFNSTVSAITTFAVIAGSVVLAPAILAGYAVKAANRDDLEHGRDIDGTVR